MKEREEDGEASISRTEKGLHTHTLVRPFVRSIAGGRCSLIPNSIEEASAHFSHRVATTFYVVCSAVRAVGDHDDEELHAREKPDSLCCMDVVI